MNLRIRRVFRDGGSLVVALPADWLRGQGIAAGDEVEIWYDGEIRIRPRHRSEV